MNHTEISTHSNFIIEQSENYNNEIKKISDWELELELKAQAEALAYTRIAIETNSDQGLSLDYILIIFRISACADEIKRRFIP